MVLNKLTKEKVPSSAFGDGRGLTASMMAAGANDYFDIGAPKNNRTALNYINYFMLSQFVSKSRENAVTQASLRRYSDNSMRYYKLNEAVAAIIDNVDEGRPFQLGYGYDGGGHAIVGVDYYIVRRNNIPQSIYLKFYDENDRGSSVAYKTKPHFCYIKLNLHETTSGDYCFELGGKRYTAKAASIDANKNERIYLYYYNYKNYKTNGTDKYTGKYITALRVRDMVKIYNNLYAMRNGTDLGLADEMNTLASGANGSTAATLTLYDVGNYYENYYIAPYAYDDGNVDDVIYADSCGVLYKPESFSPVGGSGDPDEPSEDPLEAPDYPPVPVDADDHDLPFGNMTDPLEGYRYIFHEGESDPIEDGGADGEDEGFDMEIDLRASGMACTQMRTFDGYEIILSDGYLPGVSLEKGEHYAWVSGEGVDSVCFSSDGRLRDVYAGESVPGGDLELYFGTQGELAGLDMFSFTMSSFDFLQVYDTEDDPEYANCIVLRTNGAASGFGFTFYKGELVSDEYRGAITELGDEVWIKICPRIDAQTGKVYVELYAEDVRYESPGSDNPIKPSFAGEPYYTSRPLHERVFSSDTGSSAATGSASNGDSGNQYALKGSANGERTNGGGLKFEIDADYEKHTGVAVDNKPLQKGVDYDVENGSTIITLKPAFLATLKDGTHTLTVYFTDGRMQTSFITPASAAVSTAAVPNVPATGGAPFGIAIALLGAAGLCVCREKQEKSLFTRAR